MQPGILGVALLVIGLVAALLSIGSYVLGLAKPQTRIPIWLGRIFYTVAAVSMLATFATLMFIVSHKMYRYDYAFSHTSNELKGFYQYAATWSGQEGSFLLWAAWTSIIGFLVFSKAGKYEARVMPFFISILAFLFAILLKQSPFSLSHVLTPAEMAMMHVASALPVNGQGLNASLQNYWMTIHPPTIFFGFASLAVPYCYALAALIWKDYDRWISRVMPYCLLSCATLGLGLFMGGYWAYETQGWHGFWGWDPVENASFFPWLAITALVHGLVAQKSRGGMARTNTFLGLFAFWLFLLGTFLTRSGALAKSGADGIPLSVHAFDNIGKSGLMLMVTMLAVYGIGGIVLWLSRLMTMPRRKTFGETLISRNFAFFMAVLLMVIACVVVTLGTTTPLFMSWMHKTPMQPKSNFYNSILLPLTILAAFCMGCVPWLAWRRTNPDTFLRKLMIPWFAMLVFGFFMVWWVQGAERAQMAVTDPNSIEAMSTAHAWFNPTVKRLLVIALTSLGVFAALSNAMLAFRVFRAKPLSAGGWLSHVGIGILIVGAVVSNTFERTERVVIREGDPAKNVFGYKIAFEKMTGKSLPFRPMHPEYDKTNAIQLRITPPGADEDASNNGEEKTFLSSPRWYSPKPDFVDDTKSDLMTWPSITKFIGHDYYITMADQPGYDWRTDDPNRQRPGITLMPKEKRRIGPYTIGYYDSFGEPGKVMGAHIFLTTQEGKVIEADPAIEMTDEGMVNVDNAVPELTDDNGNAGAIYLDNLNPQTKRVVLRISLPGYAGLWEVPIEVTYKPWVNLVWTGVIIAVLGALLAMVRRALEARKIVDAVEADATLPTPKREVWEMPEEDDPTTEKTPAAATGATNGKPDAPAGTNGNGKPKTPVGTNGNGKSKTPGASNGKRKTPVRASVSKPRT